MGFTKKKSIRRIFKRKQSTKKRGNRTRRHVRSAAIFRRRRTMRGGATSDAKARAEGLLVIQGMNLYYLSPEEKETIVNNVLAHIKQALDNTGLGAMGQMSAIRTAILRVAPPPPQASALASTPPSGAAGGTTGAAAAATATVLKPAMTMRPYIPRSQIPATIHGAIVIVQHIGTNLVLLGQESDRLIAQRSAAEYSLGGGKMYTTSSDDIITNYIPSLTDPELSSLETMSTKVYNNIMRHPNTNLQTLVSQNTDILVPLVERATDQTGVTPGMIKYGNHPRKRRVTTEFGAPKGVSKVGEPHIETAQREFLEEVGYRFPDASFIFYNYATVFTRNGPITYAVYLIRVDDTVRKDIEKRIAARYASHIGETFDLAFRDPTAAGLSLNNMTSDALKKLGIIPPYR